MGRSSIISIFCLFESVFLIIFESAGIGPREDITVHLGCNSEVGLAFDEGSVTLKNITILVNNKQSGISAKVIISNVAHEIVTI